MGNRGWFDQLIGWVISAIGSAGLTVQWITDFGNVALVVGNLVLVVGGLILLYQRLRLVSTERRLAEVRIRKEMGE